VFACVHETPWLSRFSRFVKSESAVVSFFVSHPVTMVTKYETLLQRLQQSMTCLFQSTLICLYPSYAIRPICDRKTLGIFKFKFLVLVFFSLKQSCLLSTRLSRANVRNRPSANSTGERTDNGSPVFRTKASAATLPTITTRNPSLSQYVV
jgi:hypothetical protein